MRRVLISGVAGFIGTNLARQLVKKKYRVVGLDNLRKGSLANLAELIGSNQFSFHHVDLSDFESFLDTMKRLTSLGLFDEVWHLAANSDIMAGTTDPGIDLRDTFMTTFNTIRIMKEFQIAVILFASSSAVYGEHSGAMHEDIGPLFPISNYGAMKLASEAVISAAVDSFLQKAYIFRFPNVVGTPATHGVIHDLVRKLKANPKRLDVLGDGNQQKAYLHVRDLIDAMLFIREHSEDKLNYFNIGAPDAGVTVKFIAENVIKKMSPDAQIVYLGGERGWVGDIPKFSYELSKINNLGWKPKWSSAESVVKAISEVAQEISRQH
ncbi:MAG: NAD-dependent epimerase/dehydratase family protein [Deltaproteobacteria bacterium]|nr:NAD-dependent epimerase/dehydratase family protein [Deltaproteobacteria bacterium]